MSFDSVSPRLRVMTTALALGFTTGLSGCASKAYDVTEQLSYDSAIGYDGTLDYYEPTSDSGRTNRPAIIAIHGGAWRDGDKTRGAIHRLLDRKLSHDGTRFLESRGGTR